MIKAEQLSKKFGPFTAVENLNFSIRRGEVVGLLGPNGAGKSTTMRMITGYYLPSAGDVYIDGLSVRKHRQEIQNKIGYLPESASSYSDMLVGDFLNFIGQSRHLAGNDLHRGLDYAVSSTHLQNFYYRPINQLSKGFRQRVGLAAALIHNPEILILDEPTSGLDPNQIREMQNLIGHLSREKTIILSTHILKEVEATCQRALIVSGGRLLLDESLESLQKLRAGARRFQVCLRGNVGNAQTLLQQHFAQSGQVEELARHEDETLLAVTSPAATAAEEIFHLAVRHNWVLRELSPERQSLEDVFQTLTSEKSGPTADQSRR